MRIGNMGEMTGIAEITFGKLEMPTRPRPPWSGFTDWCSSVGDHECV